MSKRNFILLIVVLIIFLSLGAYAFFYFYKPNINTLGGGESSGTNFLSEFFPFGKSKNVDKNTSESPADVSGFIPSDTTEDNKELLTKISSMPVAGYGIFMKERFKEEIKTIPEIIPPATEEVMPVNTKTKEIKKETEKLVAPLTEFIPALRYVERATGNIYQTFADKIDERKFTTTIIPMVYDAYFGNNGNSVVMRYLKEDGKTIESFVGSIPKEILGEDTTESNELNGNFLPENIKDISVSPDNLSIFYLFGKMDNITGIISSLNSNKKNQIFSSPFTEWLSGWPNANMITLTTKPSYNVPGFMYSIDPNFKKLNKILGDVNGLTTLASPNGKLVLYNNNSLTLRIYNTDTEDSISLGVKTMPEKCIWNKASTMLYCAVPKYVDGSRYPDTWYQGEISFSDDIWRINTENGSATNIADPTSFSKGEEIDGIKLSLDENEDYLFFVNKKDSYLWELNLK